jgi:hypothetical protein
LHEYTEGSRFLGVRRCIAALDSFHCVNLNYGAKVSGMALATGVAASILQAKTSG